MARSRGMGSIFKRKPGGAWHLSWFDEGGQRHERSARTTDRAAAQRILAGIVADVALRREGIIDAKADTFAEHGKRPLSAHLADWTASLTAKGVTPMHVETVKARARALLARCKAERLKDLSASKVQAVLGELRSDGKSVQTVHHYLRAVKQFSRWLYRDGRTREDALAHLQGYNAATDRRYERRALDAAELDRLISAAEQGPTYKRITGRDRAMLYRLASGTGFRASELRALTVADLCLDDDPPCIVLPAKHAKNRQETRQPIRGDLAELWRRWLAVRKSPTSCAGATISAGVVSKAGENAQRLFPTLPKLTAKMLQSDLRRARAQWIMETPDPAERRQRRASDFLAEADSSGRVADFHALRVSFITELVRGGASVKVAQTLARHSDPKLTLNVYTRLGVHDLAGGLDALPPVAVGPDRQRMRATGTTDATPHEIDVPARQLKRQQFERETVQNHTMYDASSGEPQGAAADLGGVQKDVKIKGNCDRTRSNSTPNRTERGGFEPPVRQAAHWFSKPAPSATRTPLQRSGRDWPVSASAGQTDRSSRPGMNTNRTGTSMHKQRAQHHARSPITVRS